MNSFIRKRGVVIGGLLALSLLAPRLRGDDALSEKIRGQQLEIERDSEFVTVRSGDKTLLRYRYQGYSHKPSVVELTTPAGINLLRDAPADHLHHHGLMFAWRVDEANFWEEREPAGRQIHDDWSRLEVVALRPLDRPTAQPSEAAVLEESLRWEQPDGRVVLEEKRSLSVAMPAPDQPRLLTWQSTFVVPADAAEVTISGTKYHGLGARFIPSLDKGGQFLNANGETGVDKTDQTQARWCAYQAAVNPQQPVTIAMFGAASNPRHPVTWFTMDSSFAYLSATMNVVNDPIKLAPGQRVTLRYAVVLFDKTASKEEIEAVYQRWQQPLSEVRAGMSSGLIGRYFAGAERNDPAMARVDRSIGFDWSDGAPDERLAPGPLAVRWDGLLHVETDGKYRFSADAEGPLQLWLDQKLLLEPGRAMDQPWEISQGYHPLRVLYEPTGDRRHVKLYWQSDSFPREVIGARFFSHSDEDQKALAGAYERGRLLVEQYGCAACHDVSATPPRKAAPPLDRAMHIGPDYLARWLRNPQTIRPGTRMPNIECISSPGLQTAESVRRVQAIAAVLRSLPRESSPAAQAEHNEARARQTTASVLTSGTRSKGREWFHEIGCIACHSPEAPQEADVVRAPSLADIGAKWPLESIAHFLESPLAWRPQGRMSDFSLKEKEAADLAAYLASFRQAGDAGVLPAAEDQKVAAIPADAEQQLIAEGKQWIEQARCAACHDIPGFATPPPRPLTAEMTLSGCLSAEAPGAALSGKTAPPVRFALTHDERGAIVEFLRHRPPQPAPLASSERAERQMSDHWQCFRCHTRDGAGGELFARGVLRYLGEGHMNPAGAAVLAIPDLSGVGAKLRPEWMAAALAASAPTPRPWIETRMPRFAIDESEKQAIVRRFVEADSTPLIEATPAPTLPPDANKTAVTLLSSQGFACHNCHYIGNHRPRGDTVGPDLTLIGKRISREWFHRWLQNPARVRPGTPMPAYAIAAKGLADENLLAQKEILWNYLTTVPPDKIALTDAPSRVVSVRGAHPHVLQGRMLGAPPAEAVRGVVIGLPGGNSLLFDSGRMAWVAHWSGGFVRETGDHGAHHEWIPDGKLHWSNRDASPPLVFRHKQTGVWTTSALWRERFGWLDRVQIEGQSVRLEYRLRGPEAKSSEGQAGPWIRVVEQIEPNPPGDSTIGFTRRLQISDVPPDYDVILQWPISGGIKVMTTGGDLAKDAAGAGISVAEHPAMQGSAGALHYVVRATGTNAKWILPPDTFVSQVAQPFTDEAVPAEETFDPLSKPAGERLALALAESSDSKTLEATLQVACFESGTSLAGGPPRVWQNAPPQEPIDSTVANAHGGAATSAQWKPDAIKAPAGFRVERLPLSDDFLVGTLAFWNGKLLVGGYDGQIRLAEDSDGDGLPDHYRMFAETLDQVTNLRVFDGAIYAATPGAVYRIEDRDGDQVADSYTLLSSMWDWSGHSFDWFFGLGRDAEGNLYGATSTPHERPGPGWYQRGSVLKISPQGFTTKIGSGTRYNFGWANNHEGRTFFNVNQGHWNITCGIHEVVPGAHYGFGEPDLSKVKPPLVRVPYPWCRALTGLAMAESSPPFGPFQGQGLSADYRTQRVIRWTIYPVGSEWQGTCYPLFEGFESGPTELVFGPDGALYVGCMSDGGWYPERPRGSIYKISYAGPPPFAVLDASIVKDGIAIRFTEPVDARSVNLESCRRVHRYFHEYKGVYNSEEVAHEDVPVHGVELSPDARLLTIRTAAHITPRIYRVELRGLVSAAGQPLDNGEMYLTAHRVAD